MFQASAESMRPLSTAGPICSLTQQDWFMRQLRPKPVLFAAGEQDRNSRQTCRYSDNFYVERKM